MNNTIGIVLLMSVVIVSLCGTVDAYTFRNNTFHENSQCSEWFTEYQTANPYDVFVQAPALMKFDKYC